MRQAAHAFLEIADSIADVAREQIGLAQAVDHRTANAHASIDFKRHAVLRLIALDRVVEPDEAELHQIIELDAGWESTGQVASNSSDQRQVRADQRFLLVKPVG